MTLCFMAMLAVHVTGGTVALLAGPVAVPAPKNRTLHRRAGHAYALAMGRAALSALCLALATAKRLLLVIAVFSFFLVFNGWRAPGQKRLHQRLGTRWFDWLLSAPTLLFSAALLLAGLQEGVVALFLGAGGSALAASEMRRLSGRIAPGGWLLRHLVDMGGAYIASVTAFAVVILIFLPPPVAFIVPTLVGTIIVRIAARVALASRGPAGPDTALREAGAPP